MKKFSCLKIVAFLLICNVAGVLMKKIPHEQNKLPIALYYEALCPYCMNFVTTQLYPSMKTKGRLPYTQLTLVPYGNARQNEDGTFTCQHGPEECELNAWHGCILEKKNIDEALKLISCMMHDTSNIINKCASKHNIDISDVKKCKNSRTIEEILRKYAKETISHNGVPAISVDNTYDENDSGLLSEHFDRQFCIRYQKKFNKKLKNC